ncbi:MAG: biotin--[acetyl-CoA-carboxylase] ligase [Candidatus Izemoplasmatales bacterium]|nr:biotin--[acetyl-CoA-carboxylase] ligase [Candidatus Izemoplasmatales bacterium]MDY0139494.1 biotin--[acetyl-CoA-carboxylase] ligase [Candidatus Izemoplasmatales bacterium]
MNYIHLKSIDSTNTYLYKNYQDLEHMTIVSTDYQTKGKGRMSRIWYGNEKSIMCSILLKEHLNYLGTILPLMVAKSLHQVLSIYHNNIKIKWPNDLLINGLKLSGILIKNIYQSNEILATIIGFGINVNQDNFDQEIKKIATSLYLETNNIFDKEELLKELVTQLDNDLKSITLNNQNIVDYCNNHSAITNKRIQFTQNNQTYIGIAEKINENGHLIVNVDNQIFEIDSSEILLSN